MTSELAANKSRGHGRGPAGSVPGSNRRGSAPRSRSPAVPVQGAQLPHGGAVGGGCPRPACPPRPTRPGSSRLLAASARRSSAQQVGWPAPLRAPRRSPVPQRSPGGPPRCHGSPPPASSPHPPDPVPSGAAAGEALSRLSPERPRVRRGLGEGGQPVAEQRGRAATPRSPVTVGLGSGGGGRIAVRRAGTRGHRTVRAGSFRDAGVVFQTPRDSVAGNRGVVRAGSWEGGDACAVRGVLTDPVGCLRRGGHGSVPGRGVG